MLNVADYRVDNQDSWRFYFIPEVWDAGIQKAVLKLIEHEVPGKHPSTIEFSSVKDDASQRYFLKLFYRRSGTARFKDFFRSSQAKRFWRQGLVLAQSGFDVPLTVALGEQRKSPWREIEWAFVVTRRVEGLPAPAYLQSNLRSQDSKTRLAIKRGGLKTLGQLIRRLHHSGFVHGDLLPGNILISRSASEGLRFYFMDNDRTRRYPPWFTSSLRLRNLIQLNRMPLAGISLQDRMRVFHAYIDRDRLNRSDRKLLRWIERRTRKRRRECDGVENVGSFRHLMNGNFSG